MSVTIPQVEEAFGAIWGGKTLNIRNVGVKDVPVFIDVPDAEEYPERVFPSISVFFTNMEPEVFENEWDEILDVDDSVTPNIVTLQPASRWFRITFQVHTWVAGDAASDRELMLFMETRKRHRDAFTIGSDAYYMFRENMASANEDDGDTAIYHRIWTYDVIVDLEDEDSQFTSPAVHEIRLRSNVIRTRRVYTRIGDRTEVLPAQAEAGRGSDYRWLPVDDSGNVVDAEDAATTLHRTLYLTDTEEGVVPEE